LIDIIERRRDEREAGSYTAYLFDSGLDKILKKLGEECAETLIAAKNLAAVRVAAAPADGAVAGESEKRGELVGEIGDLLYHLAVMMVAQGIGADDVAALLRGRMAKTGNLKTGKNIDRNT